MRRRGLGLTRRLLLLAAVALVPAIASQIYNEVDLRRERRAELHESALRAAQLAASEIESILDGMRSLLVAIAHVPEVRRRDGPACTAFLAELAPRLPHVNVLAVADADGRLLCRHEMPSQPVSVADRPYFLEALRTGEFTVGHYTVSRVTDQPTLPLSLPFADPQGLVTGVVIAGLDLGWLGQHVGQRALPEGGSLTIADGDGIILAREPLPEQFVGTRIPDPYQVWVQGNAAGTGEVLSQDGTRRILGYVPAALPPRGIYVSTGFSSEESFAAIDRATVRGVALLGLTLLLALSAAWFAGRVLVGRPVAALLGAMEAWRAGDTAARTGMPAQADEIGALGAAFDRMADEIAARQAERDHSLMALHESEERYRLIVDSASDTIIGASPDGVIRMWNPAAERLFGYTAAEAVGRPAAMLSPPDQAGLSRELIERVRRGETAGPVEAVRLRKDGRRLHVDLMLTPVRGPDGRIVAISAVIRDITERKRAEERQRLLAAELDHRVKNLLAVFQALVAQSRRGADSLDTFASGLEGRVRAMARTHALLAQGRWAGAGLRRIVEDELQPYQAEAAERATVTGPDLLLTPRAAQALSLALHELATNAAKYGALSMPGGRVAVSWALTGPAGAERLSLRWAEQGGPEVRAPERRGFGCALIERSLAYDLDGEARLDFTPQGVVCTISLSADRLVETDAEAMTDAAEREGR